MIALEDSVDEFAKDPEFVAMFVNKANQLISKVEEDLAALEDCPPRKRGELLNQIFRSVHTIKGEAGFVAMQNIGRLAHCIENILDRAREFEIDLTHEIVMRLMASLDVLRDLVGHVDTSESIDISHALAALEGREVSSPAIAPTPAPVAATTPVAVASPIVEPVQPAAEQPQPASTGPVASTAANTTEPAAAVRQTARKRTLIVDDEPIITRIAAQQLAAAGIPADEVASAEEALNLMRRNLYNVVVCDIDLPGMSGLELIPKLKEISPLVQVVMLTGKPNFATVLNSLTSGAIDFLPKTQDYKPLIESVQHALSRVDRWVPLMRSRRER